jgi:hypothetical protein
MLADEFVVGDTIAGRAVTQGNLGFALFRLGERESGARLDKAVGAYGEALREQTRARPASMGQKRWQSRRRAHADCGAAH